MFLLGTSTDENRIDGDNYKSINNNTTVSVEKLDVIDENRKNNNNNNIAQGKTKGKYQELNEDV